MELSRTTLARWVVGMGELVVPLMNLLHEELLGRAYVLMDETTVQVLKEPGKAPETKSQLWAMMSPGSLCTFATRDSHCYRVPCRRTKYHRALTRQPAALRFREASAT